MAYNIKTTLEIGDPEHVAHHIALAEAVNDLDARVTQGAVTGQTPELRVEGRELQTKLPSQTVWTTLYLLPSGGTGGGVSGTIDGGTP
jgi:hypothetical protein